MGHFTRVSKTLSGLWGETELQGVINAKGGGDMDATKPMASFPSKPALKPECDWQLLEHSNSMWFILLAYIIQASVTALSAVFLMTILSEVYVSHCQQLPDHRLNQSVGTQQAQVNTVQWDTCEGEDLRTMPSVTLFIKSIRSITDLLKLHPDSSETSD